jgi:anaerobic selenocysteine-containing dehydrogenase
MCSKGLAFQHLVYHPDRVTHPLKRAGDRGEGNWQRISWDEALDTIADRYRAILQDYGAESIVLGYGTGRNYENFLYRFSNLLGTPNVLTAGHMCYGPRIAASNIMCGRMPVCDYDGNPECVIVWGNNAVITNADEYTGENLCRTISRGTKLVVIDPRLTKGLQPACVASCPGRCIYFTKERTQIRQRVKGISKHPFQFKPA